MMIARGSLLAASAAMPAVVSLSLLAVKCASAAFRSTVCATVGGAKVIAKTNNSATRRSDRRRIVEFSGGKSREAAADAASHVLRTLQHRVRRRHDVIRRCRISWS
jgi:hypothetical protein